MRPFFKASLVKENIRTVTMYFLFSVLILTDNIDNMTHNSVKISSSFFNFLYLYQILKCYPDDDLARSKRVAVLKNREI